MINNIDMFLDEIAKALIENIDTLSGGGDLANKDFLRQHQKTVRDGITQRVISDDEKVLVFKRDEKANQEDLNISMGGTFQGTPYNTLRDIYESFVQGAGGVDVAVSVDTSSGSSIVTVTVATELTGSSPIDITPYIFPNGGESDNPLNISQYIHLSRETPIYDVNNIKEFFDIRIHELLPQQKTRQQRINQFFKEYQILKGEYPQFDDYSTPADDLIETEEGYNASHDISFIQENPEEATIPEQQSYITRLNIDSNTKNKDKTLEYLRDDLTLFLKDIDQDNTSIIQDERPLYENKSDGYLKIRNLNQGIIIRKQEGDNVGIEKDTQIPSEPNNLSGTDYYHPYYNPSPTAGDSNYLIPSGYAPNYLVDGFTITMWVKFLDTTSKGTLFNYGNPLRGYDPKGFTLETFVINKDDLLTSDRTDGYVTWNDVVEGESISGVFENTDSERFLRLVVIDNLDKSGPEAGKLYDSHLGISGMDRKGYVSDFGIPDSQQALYTRGDEKYLLTHVRVPIDFNEWYFIVATYNPMIDDNLTTAAAYLQNTDYWNNNVTTDGTYVDNSGLGSKCKIEIISKSDLLRARGFAPEEI